MYYRIKSRHYSVRLLSTMVFLLVLMFAAAHVCAGDLELIKPGVINEHIVRYNHVATP